MTRLYASHDRLSGVRPARLSPGDVPLAQLVRDIKAGAKYFWGNRPEVHRSVDATFEFSGKMRHSSVSELAAAYVAMDKPPRGLLKKMAEANGVRYMTLTNAVYLRRKALGVLK